MRAVYHTHRSILLGARIEMDAEREHMLEDFNRRLYVRDAGFLAPRSVTGNIVALRSGYRQVLVPNDFPVRLGSLVEEQRAHGEARRTENGSRERSERRCRGNRANAGIVKKISGTAATRLCEVGDTVA